MRSNSKADITIHRPEELTTTLRQAWHKAMDESPDYANPFLAPEFADGVGRYRGGAQVAVLHEGGEPVGFFPYERNPVGVGRAVGLGLSDCQALVHRPGVTWDVQQLLRACGLSVFEFDHLVEEQQPFGRYVTGTFASPVIDLKDGDGEVPYPEWLRGAYPGIAKTTLKKERRLGRDLGEMRFVYDERDPAVLRTLMRWKSAQYRRTGRMDRFARPWIVDLVDHLFRVREEHFTGILSVLYAGDRPVAAHFGPTSRTLFAAWFTRSGRTGSRPANCASARASPPAPTRWRRPTACGAARSAACATRSWPTSPCATRRTASSKRWARCARRARCRRRSEEVKK
jgi:CelD/BcsL family acetyltransferase involved in cellulose biosynthesis